jgi:hypothetical protein
MVLAASAIPPQVFLPRALRSGIYMNGEFHGNR